MTHEFKHIVQQTLQNQQLKLKSVLASVVHLDGSSYRKPGVRMLIDDHGQMTGAVSGGCVEKEVLRRAASVFETGMPKVMTYDGRYRLGCEGILYILIEPFYVSEGLASGLNAQLSSRKAFAIESFFKREDEATGNFGSQVHLAEKTYAFRGNFIPETTLTTFTQSLQPLFKLLIIGGEHDAVKLCSMASLLGWEVEVITAIKDPKTLGDFPGATRVSATPPELFSPQMDSQTAVVLMTHNYTQDLKYLLKLRSSRPGYIGILGSAKRRNRLQNEVFEYTELNEDLLDLIHSPAGLDLGAETPEEIALSILSEIMSVTKDRTPFSLKNITPKIHA